jgi:hypothetical protein
LDGTELLHYSDPAPYRDGGVDLETSGGRSASADFDDVWITTC